MKIGGNTNCEECEHVVGMLETDGYSELVTVKRLSEIEAEKRKVNEELSRMQEEWAQAFWEREFSISDYADREKDTGLQRFDYCPKCGGKIDWEGLAQFGDCNCEEGYSNWKGENGQRRFRTKRLVGLLHWVWKNLWRFGPRYS